MNRNASLSGAPVQILAWILTTLVLQAAFAATSWAQAWAFVGPRQQAMGGVGVSVVDDSTAFYWNPAAMGFKKKGEWDVQLPITVDVSIENKALARISDLAVRFDDVQQVVEGLQDGNIGSVTPTDINNAVAWFNDLGQLGDQAESVFGQASVGIFGHAGNFAFGAHSLTGITSYPNVDLENLGFEETAFQAFLDAVPVSFPGQEQALKDQIDALPNPFWTTANAEAYVDAFIGAPGVDPSNGSTARFILDSAEAFGDANNAYADNQSGVVAAGLSVQEFGVSYGYALPMPFYKPFHKKLAVGATAKYLLGISFARGELYNQNIGGGGLGDINVFKDSVISHNFGLDLAADFRPFPFLRMALQARNVNSPKFSAGEFGDIKLTPQVRMGVSLMPLENWILAVDADLMPNLVDTENWNAPEPAFESQQINMGTEYTIPFSQNTGLALRFGGYTNVSELSLTSSWGITGGLGLKLWGAHIDLSVGGSPNSQRVRTSGTEYVTVPDRLHAGLGLKWAKSL